VDVVDVPELELEERVITSVLANRAADMPDAPFVHIDGRTYSYGDMYETSRHVARALTSLGVSPGQRVVMMLRNRSEFLLAWFGTAMLGATIVPINPDWKAETLSYILADAAPAAMILTHDLLGAVEDILPGLTDRARRAGRVPRHLGRGRAHSRVGAVPVRRDPGCGAAAWSPLQ
jgi:acyl-CoA synthetase (AMP-forming)/AMP-acid ligase II